MAISNKYQSYIHTAGAVILLLIVFIFLPHFFHKRMAEKKSGDHSLIDDIGKSGVSKETVIKILREVDDPEFGENIYDLGVVKEITIIEKDVSVILQTYPGCPYRIELYLVTKKSLEKIRGVEKVRVKMVPSESGEYIKKKGPEIKEYKEKLKSL